MRIKYLVVVMFGSVICGCKVYNNKREITKNENFFEKCLTVISDSEEGRTSPLIKTYNTATLFLGLVTGVRSKADYTHTVGYENMQDYQSDFKKWNEWYSINKSRLTNSYIDSAYKSVKMVRPKVLED